MSFLAQHRTARAVPLLKSAALGASLGLRIKRHNQRIQARGYRPPVHEYRLVSGVLASAVRLLLQDHRREVDRYQVVSQFRTNKDPHSLDYVIKLLGR